MIRVNLWTLEEEVVQLTVGQLEYTFPENTLDIYDMVARITNPTIVQQQDIPNGSYLCRRILGSYY